MKHKRSSKWLKASILTFSVTLFFMAIANAQTPSPKAPVVFTEKDREFALKYANDTRDDFVKQLTGLSDSQLNFRAAEGRWTIGEIAEHIIVTENALRGMIMDGAMKSPVPAGKDDFRMNDVAVILAITNRQQKFNAPEQIRPNGRWKTTAELLANFDFSRKQTIDSMKSVKDDMRSHFMNTPLIGRTDAFQGFLFMIGHSERHLAQLKEVKAEAKYPAK